MTYDINFFDILFKCFGMEIAHYKVSVGEQQKQLYRI
jgi:hypothetical protein